MCKTPFYYQGGIVGEVGIGDVVPSGLLAEPQSADLQAPTTLPSFPCRPKIFCDLAGWQFFKCYFKSPKKGNIKVQAVHGCPS